MTVNKGIKEKRGDDMKLRKMVAVWLAVVMLVITASVNVFAGEKYVDFDKGLELSMIKAIFYNMNYPSFLNGKFSADRNSKGFIEYTSIYQSYLGSFHYIDLMEVVNLFTDGSHDILSNGNHKFIFGKNTVEFKENTNTVSINGNSFYVGKIRYAETQQDKFYKGRFSGSKIYYDQSIKTIGTWIPAEALDDILAYGLIDVGSDGPGTYGIKVPDPYKKTNFTKNSYVDLKYSTLKAKLPTNLKSQIKENFNDSLLFGEDFSDIDNYDQVAKIIRNMFSFIPNYIGENTIHKDFYNLSEQETADRLKEMSKNNEIVIRFFTGNSAETSNLYMDVFLSGLEKKNGISFSITTRKGDETTANMMFEMLKDTYPYEMTESIIKESITSMNMSKDYNSPGNLSVSKFNIVRATGNYKYFYGNIPDDHQLNCTTWFLIDNHPSMPNEAFCSAGPEIYWKSFKGDGSGLGTDWGRGYREDFFTFTDLPADVRKSLGMPEIYDSINYNYLTISPNVRSKTGTTMAPLQKCTNNPYGTYKRLSTGLIGK